MCIYDFFFNFCRVRVSYPLPNIDDDERRLRESRPTAINISELVQLMHNTRENRRSWINTCNPDATCILNRFPRLFDVNELVCFCFFNKSINKKYNKKVNIFSYAT